MFVYTLGTIVSVLMFIIIILFYTVHSVKTYFQQRKCTHDSVFETRACDAICNDCGKNLGFIQNWRDARKERK